MISSFDKTCVNIWRGMCGGREYRERKISPKFFRPKFFRGRPRGTSVPKCLFFQDLEGLTEVFGRMSAGMSGPKLPLWAEFSFLRIRREKNR